MVPGLYSGSWSCHLHTCCGAKIAVRKDSTSNILLGDIGGTYARFALADRDSDGFAQLMTYQCEDFDNALQAIQAYLAEMGSPMPAIISIAAAGPVIDGNLHLTNNHWKLDQSEFDDVFPAGEKRFLNDFEAVAQSLPNLQQKDVRLMGGPQFAELDKSDFTVAVIGPGTGLGIAGLCKRGGRIISISGEGGNASFAPESPIQLEVLKVLSREFKPVSIECLLSGPGVVNVYRALCEMNAEPEKAAGPSDVFAMSIDDKSPSAKEAAALFFEILGQAAGNLALTLGAIDGIFVGGGIVPRYADRVLESPFRAGFERKGRYRKYMERIPTLLITHSQPGLLGTRHCALQMLKDLDSQS
jgi:glucokinase